MPYEVKVEEKPAQPVAAIRTKVPEGEVGGTIGNLIGEIGAYLGRIGAHPAGAPYARSAWAPGADLEVGFPIPAAVASDGRVIMAELPGGKHAVAWHTGGYDQVRGAHEAVRAWIAEQGLTEAGAPWEVYWTDPAAEPDPARWRTEVVYPVR